VRERLGVRLELFEQLADAIVDESVVDEALERGELRGAGGVAGVGHHHQLVPVEDVRRAPKVGDLAEAVLELGERRFHGRGH
jgi:hypothetical protein